MLNSIGPVWDGNEVWLVLGGGALFAAFPMVYASLFSGLYIAMMLILLVLILRTVAIEFRSKRPTTALAQLLGFGLLSLIPGHCAAAGRGLWQHHRRACRSTRTATSTPTLVDLLTPYALLVGVTTVFMLATHGAIYLSMKTSGELLDRVKRWVPRLMVIFFVLQHAAGGDDRAAARGGRGALPGSSRGW